MNATGFTWLFGACLYLWTGGVLIGFPFGLLAGFVWASSRIPVTNRFDGDINITVPATASAQDIADAAMSAIRQQRRGLV